MKTIHAIFVYSVLVNICVVARGGSHGGGHGGHSGHGSQGTHGSHGYHHVSSSHTHYNYHPPNHIYYTCRGCTSPVSYPVYRHQPPTYVYMYKDSGGRYSQLLTGLALYNLGRTVEVGHHPNLHYSARQQETCSLQVIDRSHFEETKFPCFMISSFITSSSSNTTRVIDITSPQIDVKPYVRSRGDPLEVKDSQQCVLWHNLTNQAERNHIPCTVLQEYANTIKSTVPVYIWLPTLLGCIVAVYLCCQCFSKKKKESIKEEAPLNNAPVVGYCANY